MGGRKYEYVLEPVEIREFSRKAMAEQFVQRWQRWLVLALILIADGLLIPEGIGLLALMLAALFLVSGLRNTLAVRRQLSGQRWTLCIADGRLQVTRGNYSEVPCESIQFIRITRRLLMMGYLQAPGRPAWYVMPLRVFESEQEGEWFLGQLRSPKYVFGAEGFRETENGGGNDAPQTVLHLSYMLDEEKWVRFNKEALALVHAGTLGQRERLLAMAFYGVFMAVLFTACISLAAGGFRWQAVVGGLFVTVLFLLRLFFRDPERALQRQIRTPVMAKRNCGFWQISFTDRGIMIEQPGQSKDFYVWENLGWMVETEIAFYLFSKDKKRFIIVPKESFLAWDQVRVFHQLCGERGIGKVAAKRMHYVPGWALVTVFFAVVFVGACIMAFHIFRDYADGTGFGQTGFRKDMADTGALPGYVPIDLQAETLRSLGLTVHEETVESAKTYIDMYDMGELVEGNPYTWLLTDMGAPEYDEDWKIVGYSDEVFWFDFEGFDLSTDYIEILWGMLALSQGSSLDSVTDIEENTEGVDWDRGRGEVVVSLNWNHTRYQWDVEAYNDWIDSDVLGMLNTLLKEADSQEYFYATGDNGQGAIVFFCTEEWAQAFTEATGLGLECVFTPYKNH